MYTKYKCDSLSLRYSLSYVKVLDKRLTSPTFLATVDPDDSEQYILDPDDPRPPKPFLFVCPKTQILTRYRIVDTFCEGIATKMVDIVVTAKMLGRRYLDGINKETFRIIYNKIQSESIIDLGSYEDALHHGYPFDVDFCHDYQQTEHHYLNSLREFKNKVKTKFSAKVKYFKKNNLHGKTDDDITLFNRLKDSLDTNYQNLGLAFNMRKGSTLSMPHIKIYSKSHELLTKSYQFSQYYKIDFPDDLRRIELTIKSSKQKKSLGLDYSSLDDLFSITSYQIRSAIFRSLRRYFDVYDKKTIKDISNFTPLEMALLSTMNQTGITPDEILSEFPTYESGKTAKEKKRNGDRITKLRSKLLELAIHIKNCPSYLDSESSYLAKELYKFTKQKKNTSSANDSRTHYAINGANTN